jgi:hypothetical protein
MSASGNANNIFKQDTFQQSNEVYDRELLRGATIPVNGKKIPNTYPRQFEDYKTAFNPLQQIPFNGPLPKGEFFNHNFLNPHQLLHNDLYENVLHEEIREYSILIDSKDRNCLVYPDPFKFRVSFKPLPTQRDLDGLISATPAPVINESICNIRYIKLETVILPNWTFITPRHQVVELENGAHETIELWNVDRKRALTRYLYTVMIIDELCDSSSNLLSTNDLLSDSFATIYYDQPINDTHYLGTTSNGFKTFPVDKLYELTNLTIRFLNPYGEPLCCPHLDKKYRAGFECTCDIGDIVVDDKQSLEFMDYQRPNCFLHNLRHPLNPLWQLHINLRIGVYQPNLNKMPFN